MRMVLEMANNEKRTTYSRVPNQSSHGGFAIVDEYDDEDIIEVNLLGIVVPTPVKPIQSFSGNEGHAFNRTTSTNCVSRNLGHTWLTLTLDATTVVD